MHKEKKSKLTFRSEDLAVPEIHTGALPESDELPEPDEEIQYDTLAVPEIHLGRRKPKE